MTIQLSGMCKIVNWFDHYFLPKSNIFLNISSWAHKLLVKWVLGRWEQRDPINIAWLWSTWACMFVTSVGFALRVLGHHALGNGLAPSRGQAIARSSDGVFLHPKEVYHKTQHQNSHTCVQLPSFNILRPEQNGWHFADNILTCIFWIENCCIFNSMKFVLESPPDNKSSLVQVLAWRWMNQATWTNDETSISLTRRHHLASASCLILVLHSTPAFMYRMHISMYLCPHIYSVKVLDICTLWILHM